MAFQVVSSADQPDENPAFTELVAVYPVTQMLHVWIINHIIYLH